MTILGLDMSSKSSAYSLFIDNKLVDYGYWKNDDKDWRKRIIWMGQQLSDFINTHKIDKIYIEDVPLAMANPQTLKILSALQGVVCGVVASNNIDIDFISVSKWRSDLGLFTGKRDGMTREAMKESSIEYANKTFGLNLVWKSKSSKFNEDDLSDAINVAWSQIKNKDKKVFGRR